MFVETLVLLVSAFALFLWYIKTVKWNYWKNQGVLQITGSIPFEDLFMTKHVQDIKVQWQSEFVQKADILVSGFWMVVYWLGLVWYMSQTEALSWTHMGVKSRMEPKLKLRESSKGLVGQDPIFMLYDRTWGYQTYVTRFQYEINT